jgi:hypothetical protein
MESRFSALYHVNERSEYPEIQIEKDQHTKDEHLKYKIRSLNLIKYNPNLFTNRSRSNFYEVIGGFRSVATILGCGSLALLYRVRVNSLRNIALREGVWFNTFYFIFGASVGALYSVAFFWRWQLHFNDYYAHYLFKRYKGSDQIQNRNIYYVKDVENSDEIYHFSQSFANTAHV